MTMLKGFRTAALWALLAIAAGCGGGGGGAVVDPDTQRKEGVFTGFAGDLAWERDRSGLDNEGIGGGADGDGGFGVGGALGQFRGALVKVFLADGTQLGEALTDDVAGMVTVRPPEGYQGALRLEIHGNDQASYFEEGRNAYVPYPPGRVLHAVVSSIDRNIGITPFTEAGYQLALQCQGGQAPADVCGSGAGAGGSGGVPGPAAIASGNGFVRQVLNRQFPSSLHVDEVTRLPFIVNDNTPAGAIATDQRGRYGLVNVAFSKQAAMYNDGPQAPTLAATDAFAEDLLDGRFDGRRDGRPVAPASQATYDPHSWGSELSSALAQQTGRYGNSAAEASLPGLVSFGNVRYDSYYFDARIRPAGDTATVAVATETASNKRTPGQVTTYVAPANGNRGFMVYGNLGSGGLFIKTDDGASRSSTLVIGDNVNGELGNGSTGDVPQPQSLNLPGVLTHAVGGFGHSTFRLADGSVYSVGDNGYGQLGQGRLPPDLASSTQPVRVTLPAGAVAVAATYAASFALLENGQVYAWGGAVGFGELGNGQASGRQPTPQPVLGSDGNPLTGVVQISARDNDVIVLRADGSVLTWGSFTQASRGQVPFGVQPGYTRATPVQGLPADGEVRKVLTEEGLFIVLLHGGSQHGAVYAWGVHFDITAQDYLYDLNPVRVLNLPPVRDIMPGGFLGYGQQPSARTTGMGVDYSGRFWKIRGRVAERYDPQNPTAQRRPQGQAPRADCASCHTIRGDGDPPPPSADAPECVLPGFKLDAAGQPFLVNSASDCAACHNGNALSDGRVLAPLACRAPALPPPPAPTNAEPKTGRCQLPVGHPDTPSGTFCATCHNQVVTAPLACSPDDVPVPPPSTTTVAIAQAFDDVGSVTGAVASGGVTDDKQPELAGTTSAPLASGESVRILRDGVDIGEAVTHGATDWSFAVPELADGQFRFTARVLNAGGAAGQDSATFDLTVATAGPAKAVTVTGVTDNAGPQTGPVAAGGSTNDDSPQVTGTVSPALDAGEVIRVWRNGSLIATVTAQGGNWSHVDGDLANALGGEGDVSYSAQVVSAAGVAGAMSAAYTVRFDSIAPAVPALAASADLPDAGPAVLRDALTGALVAGRGTSDPSPTLVATFASSRSDERIVFTMSTANAGQSSPPIDTVGAGNGQRRASFTFDTGLNGNGATAGFGRSQRTFFARAVDAAGNESALSTGFALDVGFFACNTLFTKYTGHLSTNSSCQTCHSAVGPGQSRLDLPGSSNWCTFDSGEAVATPR